MLGVFLLHTVRSYERESAGEALSRVEELSREIEALETRIRNLESIASIDPSSADDVFETGGISRTGNRTRN